MKYSYWVRRTHKWIGLVVGVQALLWMISGVYMTVVPLEIIHGDHLAHVATDSLNRSAERITISELTQAYPGLTSFRLKQLMGKEVYELRQGAKIALVDAKSGIKMSPLTREAVLLLANDLHHGDGEVSSVEWITQAPQEVGTRPVPMWAVNYAEQGDTTLYFSPYSGELLAKRHNLWRVFDFVWMLHIMDYDTRSDVNTTLLRVATITGLAFALSGIWLLLYSFQRKKIK